jgi:exodeoxyribonuclease VII small subunit
MSEPRRQSLQPDEPSFEAALAHLEAIVTQLETGDLSLEESLRQFEDGIRLSRICSLQLDAAETRIQVLIQESGLWQSRSFDPEAGLES